LNEIGNPYAVVATKADKLKKSELIEIPKRLKASFHLPEGQPVVFSSETSLGKREVWKLIKDALLNRGVFSDENYELISDDEGEEADVYEEYDDDDEEEE
jgi:hypothetical protein